MAAFLVLSLIVYSSVFLDFCSALEVPLDFALDSFVCHRVDEHLVRGRESAIEVPPFACRFSKNSKEGHMLAVADEDGSVQLLDSNKYGHQAVVKEWTAHSNAIFDLAWMDGEPKLVTASGDQTAVLWDVHRGGQHLAMFRGHSCSLKSVNFRENDIFTFATGARDGNVMVWDIRCNRRSGFYQPVNTIHSAHNQQPATPQRVRKRSRSTRRGSVPQPVVDSQQSVTAVIFQGDHTLISAGAMDGNIKLWDLRKNYTTASKGPIPYHVFPYPGTGPRKHGFSSLCLDSTQTKLYASCTNDTIYMYECSVLCDEPICSYFGHSNSTFYVKAVLSPDDCYLLSGSSNNDAHIWKVSQPENPPALLKGHTGEVTSVSWCPTDQGKIITCSDDNNVRIWRMLRGMESRNKSDFVGHSERLPGKQQINSETSQQSQKQPCTADAQSPLKLPKTMTSPKNRCLASPLPSKIHTSPRLNPLSSPVAKVTVKACHTPPRKLTIKCACPNAQQSRSPFRKCLAEKNQPLACPVSPIAHVPTCPLSPGPSPPRCQSPQQLLRSWLKVTPPRKSTEGSQQITQSPVVKTENLKTPGSRKALGKTLSKFVTKRNDEKDIEMMELMEGDHSKSPSFSPARKRQCIEGPSQYTSMPLIDGHQSKCTTVDNKQASNNDVFDQNNKENCTLSSANNVESSKPPPPDDKSPNWLTAWRLNERKNGNENGGEPGMEQNSSSVQLGSELENGVNITVRPEQSILYYFKPTLRPISEQCC